MGPSALKNSRVGKKLEQLGYKVEDTGDINIEIMERQKVSNPKLKYLDEILKTSKMLAARVEKVLEQKKFPLCIGGDHSMALGTIAGISSYCKKNNLTLGVIWIDAHADMNTDQTTPSGNIHGMPLAASLGLGYDDLVNLYGFTPKLKPENCAVIAARSIDPQERLNIKKLDLNVYTMSDVDKLGVHRIISRVLKQFKEKVDHIHVSFDVDSVDPNFAPGVGTPVPGGLNLEKHTHLWKPLLNAVVCHH